MERRAIAITNANWFRALAWKALRDGGPKSELRASNARTAARIVLRQARRDARVYASQRTLWQTIVESSSRLAADEMPIVDLAHSPSLQVDGVASRVAAS
jgi:hypothetical protein